MKKWFIVLLLGFVVIPSGCATQNQQERIREGVMMRGISQQAFLNEWGAPDKTRVFEGEKNIARGVDWNSGAQAGGVSVSRGRYIYEAWLYEKKGVELVFSNHKLVNWKTEKTSQELKTTTP